MNCFRIAACFIAISILTLNLCAQQKNKAVQDSQAIFSDLPIDDPSSNSVLAKSENASQKIRQNMLVKGSLNKTTAFLGEPLFLSYRLYSRLNSTSKLSTRPELRNFSAAEPLTLPDSSLHQNLNGKIFRMFTILAIRVSPIATGQISINPIYVDNEVSYISNDGKTHHYTGSIKSNSIQLTVLDLPQKNKPEGFSGPVGRFSITDSVYKTTLAAGEKNMLHVEISGKGNFDNLVLPVISWPSGIDHFISNDHFIAGKALYPFEGRKLFDIPFVPDKTGEYLIPPLRFAAFDPVTKDYYECKTNALFLHVSGTLLPSKDGKQIPQHKEPNPNPLRSVWKGLIVLVLMVAGFELYRNRKNRLDRIREEEILKEAGSQAAATKENRTDFGNELQQLQSITDDTHFYESLRSLLARLIRETFATSHILEEELIQQTEERTNDKALVAQIRDVFDLCGRQIYAPTENVESRYGISEKLKSIIDRMKAFA